MIARVAHLGIAQRHRRILVASDDGVRIVVRPISPVAQDGVLKSGTMATSHIDAIPIPGRRGAGRPVPVGVTTYAVIFVGGEVDRDPRRSLRKQRPIHRQAGVELDDGPRLHRQGGTIHDSQVVNHEGDVIAQDG